MLTIRKLFGGVSPTITTRPEGFKTAILVVVEDKGTWQTE